MPYHGQNRRDSRDDFHDKVRRQTCYLTYTTTIVQLLQDNDRKTQKKKRSLTRHSGILPSLHCWSSFHWSENQLSEKSHKCLWYAVCFTVTDAKRMCGATRSRIGKPWTYLTGEGELPHQHLKLMVRHWPWVEVPHHHCDCSIICCRESQGLFSLELIFSQCSDEKMILSQPPFCDHVTSSWHPLWGGGRPA